MVVDPPLFSLRNQKRVSFPLSTPPKAATARKIMRLTAVLKENQTGVDAQRQFPTASPRGGSSYMLDFRFPLNYRRAQTFIPKHPLQSIAQSQAGLFGTHKHVGDVHPDMWPGE